MPEKGIIFLYWIYPFRHLLWVCVNWIKEKGFNEKRPEYYLLSIQHKPSYCTNCFFHNKKEALFGIYLGKLIYYFVNRCFRIDFNYPDNKKKIPEMP